MARQWNAAMTAYFPENLSDYAPWVARHGLLFPYGRCQCGCGQEVTLSKYTDSKRGIKKGLLCRFVKAHSIPAIRSEVAADPNLTTRLIPLTKGYFTIVDAADYEWLMQWRWRVWKGRNIFYACRKQTLPGGKTSWVVMHREILGPTSDLRIDHRDGDGLNNTRENLRFATNQQNAHNSQKPRNNTSGFKGVTWDKNGEKWVAQIQCNGKQMAVGRAATPEEAARMYDKAARELFGEFARCNFEAESAVTP